MKTSKTSPEKVDEIVRLAKAQDRIKTDMTRIMEEGARNER